MIVTGSPATGLPSAPTVAVTVLVDVPSAVMLLGARDTAIVSTGQVVAAVYVLAPAGTLVHPDCRPPYAEPTVVTPVSGSTVEVGRSGERVREIEAAQDGQPFRVAVRGRALDCAGRAP